MVALLVVLPAVGWGLRVIEVGQIAKNVFNLACHWQNQTQNCWKEVKTTDTKAEFKYYWVDMESLYCNWHLWFSLIPLATCGIFFIARTSQNSEWQLNLQPHTPGVTSLREFSQNQATSWQVIVHFQPVRLAWADLIRASRDNLHTKLCGYLSPQQKKKHNSVGMMV